MAKRRIRVKRPKSLEECAPGFDLLPILGLPGFFPGAVLLGGKAKPRLESNVVHFAGNGLAQIVDQPDPRRLAITLSALGVHYAIDFGQAVPTSLISGPFNALPITYSREQLGDLITYDVRYKTASAGTTQDMIFCRGRTLADVDLWMNAPDPIWPAQRGHAIKLTTSLNDQLVEGPDPSRVCVLLPPSPHSYSLVFGRAATVNTFQFGQATVWLPLTRDILGDMITFDMHLRSGSGATALEIWVGTEDTAMADLAGVTPDRGPALAVRGHPVTITATGADQVVEGPDPKRVAVYVPSVPHIVYLHFGGAASTSNFQVAANAPPFYITRDQIGDMITWDLHCNGTAADKIEFWIGTVENY